MGTTLSSVIETLVIEGSRAIIMACGSKYTPHRSLLEMKELKSDLRGHWFNFHNNDLTIDLAERVLRFFNYGGNFPTTEKSFSNSQQQMIQDALHDIHVNVMSMRMENRSFRLLVISTRIQSHFDKISRVI